MSLSPRLRAGLKYALSALMIVAGLNHFLSPAFYVALMPPFLPAPQFLVYLSGAAEIGLGAALLWPRYSRLAAWGIIALLIAVFPANIYHAVSGGLDDPALPAFMAEPLAAWARLPFQAAFVLWAWLFTRPESHA